MIGVTSAILPQERTMQGVVRNTMWDFQGLAFHWMLNDLCIENINGVRCVSLVLSHTPTC
jgi:hypothetical protein